MAEIEENQAKVTKWVMDVTADHWLQNMQAVENWKEIAIIVGEEKTRDELIKYLDGIQVRITKSFATLRIES
jgi:hypothetical protein